MSYDNEACVYDSLGNPITYRGKALKWSHINRLREYDNVRFDYNANGIRTKKIEENTETKFYYSGDNLLAEQRKRNIRQPLTLPLDEDDEIYIYPEELEVTDIQYLYGFDGITGFQVKKSVDTIWQSYYYRKNLQGDVTQIVDNNGAVKAEYVYDAWGNHKIISDVGGIGKLNPFRYRGYYYDSETGLYYLQSRCSDSEAEAVLIKKTKKNLRLLFLLTF